MNLKININYIVKMCLSLFGVSNLICKFASRLNYSNKYNKLVSISMGSWFLDPMTSYSEIIIVLYHQISSAMFVVAVLVLALLVFINNAHGRFDRDFLKYTVRSLTIVYTYLVTNVFFSFPQLKDSEWFKKYSRYFSLMSYMRFCLSYYETVLQQIRVHELIRDKMVADMQLDATEYTEIEYSWSSMPAPLLVWMVTSSTSANYSQDGLSDPILSVGSEGSQWSWDYDFAISFSQEVPIQASFFKTMWVFQSDEVLEANKWAILEYKEEILNVVGHWIDNYLYNEFFFDFIERAKKMKSTELLSTFFDGPAEVDGVVNLSNFKFLGSSIDEFKIDLGSSQVNFLKAFGRFYDLLFLNKDNGLNLREFYTLYNYSINYIKTHDISMMYHVFIADYKGEVINANYVEGYLNYRMRLAFWFNKFLTLNDYESRVYNNPSRVYEATAEQQIVEDFFGRRYEDFLYFILMRSSFIPFDLKYVFLNTDLRLSVIKGLWLNNTMITKEESFTLFYKFNAALYKVEDEIRYDYIYNDVNVDFNYLRLLAADRVVLVPMDVPLRITSSATDVIHSFSMPAAGVKADAIPGRSNEIFLTFRRPGMVLGMCSELCGVNHGFMPITFEVLPYDAYAVIIKKEKGLTKLEYLRGLYALLDIKASDVVYGSKSGLVVDYLRTLDPVFYTTWNKEHSDNVMDYNIVRVLRLEDVRKINNDK